MVHTFQTTLTKYLNKLHPNITFTEEKKKQKINDLGLTRDTY